MEHPDFSLQALYDALDQQRRARQLTWTAAAREISRVPAGERGIAVSTVSGVRDRRAAEGDGVLQMLLWLGRSPESFVPGLADAADPRFRLPEPGAGRILRWDTRALYAALDAQREARGMTWGAVAQAMGWPPTTRLTGLARGGRTTFPGVMRIVRWLDRPAADFTRLASG